MTAKYKAGQTVFYQNIPFTVREVHQDEAGEYTYGCVQVNTKAKHMVRIAEYSLSATKRAPNPALIEKRKRQALDPKSKYDISEQQDKPDQA